VHKRKGWEISEQSNEMKKANKESSTRENQRKRSNSFCDIFTNLGHQNPGSGLDPYPYQMNTDQKNCRKSKSIKEKISESKVVLTLATLILPLCLQATVSSVASRSPHFSHSSV
jgi:hypothetical protein